jgi:hypothetical protein
MEGLALTSAKAETLLADSFRHRIKNHSENLMQVDDQSTKAGSGSSSSSSSEVEIVRREPQREVVLQAALGSERSSHQTHAIASHEEEGWHTPASGAAESRDPLCLHDPNAIAAAVASAPSPPQLPPREDWWGDAQIQAVQGLEAAPSLTRLIGVELVSHPGVGKSRPTPWMEGESHGRYQRLGARLPAESYVALWLNRGDFSMLSMYQAVDKLALERCLSDDPLNRRLKLIIRAVKCALPFPGKGPKDADTVGTFFGGAASLTRSLTAEGAEIVVLQIDLHSIWYLRLALQNVGFRPGNVVDILVVDWPGRAVFASHRLALTESFFDMKDRTL